MFNTSPCIATFGLRIDKYLNGNTSSLPQSFMFHSTTAGVGKTTLGRIIAVALNTSLTDKEKEDILNGKSNELFTSLNGGDFKKLDDFRSLQKQIEYRESGMWGYNYVYMINEAHNITRASQELLLDLVETLPNNVFILFTTTELSSIHDKLMTRLETHEFRPLNKGETKKLLIEIAEKEGHTLNDKIAEEIFHQEGGSARAAIVALGSYLNTGSIHSHISDDKEVDNFNELIILLIKVVLGKKITWIRDIKPAIIRTIDSDPVQARSLMVKKLCSKVLSLPSDTSTGLKPVEILKVSDLYLSLIHIYTPTVISEPWHDMVLRTFRAYKESIRIRDIGS
jgi:DNA polymerase III delta prime subunit